MSAWDAQRPPEAALIGDCVHCGFCLPACPTYELWGEEMDSPRGRIDLMALGHEQAQLSQAMVSHFDRCLGCMGCVSACPSGVRYDVLLLQARAQVERLHRRPRAEAAGRAAIFALFCHPRRLEAIAPLLGVARRARVERLVPARLARLRAAAALAPEVPPRAARTALPLLTPAVGERRGTVALLQGCVQRFFFADVNRATAAVLAAEGFEVHAPRAPRCCGSLLAHTGYERRAQACARETVASLGGYDTVIVNAAGCGSGMKEYGRLIGDHAFAGRVRDVHEFLAEVGPRATRHPLALRVAYHDACHLAHAQGIRRQPRELLRAIPGVTLLEAPDDRCCGSAGIYNLLQPQAAAQLGARKAATLADTGAQVIAAANPGCALQLSAHLPRPLPVLHPIQLLARSLRVVDR